MFFRMFCEILIALLNDIPQEMPSYNFRILSEMQDYKARSFTTMQAINVNIIKNGNY